MNVPHLDPYLGASVNCLFQVHFYGLHQGKNSILHVKVTSIIVHHQADVHMCNALVLFIGEEHNEYGSRTAVHVWLDALWLEVAVSDQALQIGKGDPLHVQGVPRWCKADVPKAEDSGDCPRDA